MNTHPYASAYSTMASSFPSSSLQDHRGSFSGSASFGGGGGSQAGDNKRPRTSTSNDKGGDSDDEDDEDDDSEDEAPATTKAAANKPNRKIVKGPDGKPKVKLTRGSRACIAWVSTCAKRRADSADAERSR